MDSGLEVLNREFDAGQTLQIVMYLHFHERVKLLEYTNYVGIST